MLREAAATWEARPSTPARARALVERVLQGAGQAQLVATAVLLTSELVTNAVEHAGGLVSLHAQCDDRMLRVEVGDADSKMPLRLAAVEGSNGGRGMHLVDALATRWSTRAVDGGKVVWFELAVH